MKIICTQWLNSTLAGCSDLHQRKSKQANREQTRDAGASKESTRELDGSRYSRKGEDECLGVPCAHGGFLCTEGRSDGEGWSKPKLQLPQMPAGLGGMLWIAVLSGSPVVLQDQVISQGHQLRRHKPLGEIQLYLFQPHQAKLWQRHSHPLKLICVAIFKASSALIIHEVIIQLPHRHWVSHRPSEKAFYFISEAFKITSDGL